MLVHTFSPVLRRQSEIDIRVWGQLGLHRKFKVSQDHTEKLSFPSCPPKIENQNKQNKPQGG